MVAFPNAKINLGLFVTEKRNDGYHNLETCMIPIPWQDGVEIIPAKKFAFSSTGIQLPDRPEKNLVVRAFRLLQKELNLEQAQIHLHKSIPSGAGLGGGSADAAFMLNLMNEQFQLFLDSFILEDYAEILGSDCPFFINNEPAIATGKGEMLEPLDHNPLENKHLAVIVPNIHISTQEAYSGIIPRKPPKSIRSILQEPIENWREELVNDFETSIFPQYPELEGIKSKLYEEGALYAGMTGSGSGMYGVFEEKKALSSLEERFEVRWLYLNAEEF